VNKDEDGDERRLAGGELAKVAYGQLLRQAAGTSTADYVFAERDVRQVIHDAGRATLVHAAGWDMSAYAALPPVSKARSDVLLKGAAALGIETEWTGWP
jgi:hypothetical protein